MEPRGADGAPTRKTAALPGFVSTAVLTSSDGLFGDNVEETRVLDAPEARAQDAAGYKPLFDRLQEMKDQKDKEWKEKNNPFAPPKALDDEEIEFIRDLEARRADSEASRKVQQAGDRAEFLLARESAKTQSAPSVSLPVSVSNSVSLSDVASKPSAAPLVVKAKKRKPQPKDDAATQGKKKKKVESTAVVATALALGGLVGYGSDSESDEGER